MPAADGDNHDMHRVFFFFFFFFRGVQGVFSLEEFSVRKGTDEVVEPSACYLQTDNLGEIEILNDMLLNLGWETKE